MLKLTIILLLLQPFVIFAEAAKSVTDGFEAVFSEFASSARAGELSAIAKYAGKQIFDYYPGQSFEEIVAKGWRLESCVLRSAERYTFREGRVTIVQAIVEIEYHGQNKLVSMVWLLHGGKWIFLDFPFPGSGVLSTNVFVNYSMSELTFDAIKPNQALLPTPTAVTDPALQAPRQP